MVNQRLMLAPGMQDNHAETSKITPCNHTWPQAWSSPASSTARPLAWCREQTNRRELARQPRGEIRDLPSARA